MRIKKPNQFRYIFSSEKYNSVLKHYLFYILNVYRCIIGVNSSRTRVGYKTFKHKPYDWHSIKKTRASKKVRLKLSFKKYKVK